MFFKTILLFFFFSFNLGIAGEAHLDELKLNMSTKTASDHLNDYYSDYKQPVHVHDDDCNGNSNPTPKQKTLANYYSEYSQK